MTDLAVIGSPKRKRNVDDEAGRAQSPLRLRTETDADLANPQYGASSPRSHMSNEFRSLQIEQDHNARGLSFRGKVEGPPSSPSINLPSSAPPMVTTYNRASDFKGSSRSQDPTLLQFTPLGDTQILHGSPQEHERPQPATPLLNPVSPADAPNTISPLRSVAQTPTRGSRVVDSSQEHEPPPSPTPSGHKPPEETSPSRIKSPPPAAITSDLVWSESEITGHDPSDPNDDGYGINGIGFRPTPAMAAARAIKRRQQVTDWKARELRDARNRRAERRRGAGMDRTLSSGGLNEAGTSDSRKVVRFVEG